MNTEYWEKFRLIKNIMQIIKIVLENNKLEKDKRNEIHTCK